MEKYDPTRGAVQQQMRALGDRIATLENMLIADPLMTREEWMDYWNPAKLPHPAEQRSENTESAVETPNLDQFMGGVEPGPLNEIGVPICPNCEQTLRVMTPSEKQRAYRKRRKMGVDE